jgi:drug/metabolite transporter (DMT)-like permease
MNKFAVMLGLLSAALFGAATPASKWILSGLSPFQLAGFLYLGAAIAVAPIVIRKGGLALPHSNDTRNRMRLLGAIIFGGVLAPVALLFALKTANATSVSLWLNLELAVTAVFGVLFFHDHLGRKSWLGVLFAFSATILLSWSQGLAGITAGLLMLITCFCWGLDNHFTALIDGITPSQSTLWKGLVAGTINLSIGLILDPLPKDFYVIGYAMLVGMFSYGASIVLYIQSAQDLGATRAQILFSSAPFFGVGLSQFFLGEPLLLVHVISAILFIFALLFLLLDSHSHSHEHLAIAHEHSHRHDDGHHTHLHDGLSPSTRHTHQHEHVTLLHHHPHWPDLHHRHEHPC